MKGADLMCNNYLVTGATGQLGGYIVNMLLEKGNNVRALLGAEEDASWLENAGVQIFRGETFMKDSMKDFFAVDDSRQSILIHAEERVSISNQKDLTMRRINVAGTVNVVDMCIKHKIGRMVYVGSAYALAPSNEGIVSGTNLHFDRNKVDGDYAETKAEASAYIMEKVSLNKFNAVIVLPTFIIGPGANENSDIQKVLRGYLDKDISTVKGGHGFVDVRDVAAGVVAAAENGEAGAGYILTGEYKTTLDFFQEVCEVVGVEKNNKMMPEWLTRKGVAKYVDAYYKLTHKENPKDVYALFRMAPDAQYSCSDSESVLGVKPKEIKDSIKDTVEWMETYTSRVAEQI